MDLSTLPLRVAALYRFCRVAYPDALRTELLAFCREHGLRGTLILAAEGINGTVAGSDAAVDALIAFLAGRGIGDLELKFSRAAEPPFHRMKVRVKREIVTMGVAGIDPVDGAGTYVEASDWNALMAKPDTVVIDTRNEYETGIGRFRGALDPQTATFRDFPAWAERQADALRGRRVALYCTGGIRCEKATAYVKSLGVEDVFHLKGGILRYLEEVAPEASLWDGECFVFDERVAVVHGLAEGQAELCRACRRPVDAAERASSLFERGISCSRCHGERDDSDRARYAERHRQVERAAARGSSHIGS